VVATSSSACVAGWCSQPGTSCLRAGIRQTCAWKKPACDRLLKPLPGKCGVRNFDQFQFVTFHTSAIPAPFLPASSRIPMPLDSFIIASSIGSPETDRGPPCS